MRRDPKFWGPQDRLMLSSFMGADAQILGEMGNVFADYQLTIMDLRHRAIGVL